MPRWASAVTTPSGILSRTNHVNFRLGSLSGFEDLNDGSPGALLLRRGRD